MRKIHTKIVIVGAGVAGAWTWRALKNAGADPVLLEHTAAGQGQTIAAQGILHSGVKYGLDGTTRAIGELLQTQPPIWLAAMRGEGAIDLSSVEVLAKEQLMWASGGWFSSVAASIGSRAMRGEVREVPQNEWPTALAGHRGKVHAIQELVVSTRSILTALLNDSQNRAFSGEIESFQKSDKGLCAAQITLPSGEKITLRADFWVFTAGLGNERLAELAELPLNLSQRRPLTMGMLLGKLPPLFGHAVAARSVPRLTISSHSLGDDTLWYLGGELAESGPTCDRDTLRQNTGILIKEIFPKFDLNHIRWAPWDVIRAEPRQHEHKRPDAPELKIFGNTAIGWPTKMVYAPALAELVRHFLSDKPDLFQPTSSQIQTPPLTTGQYPWEMVSDWTSLT